MAQELPPDVACCPHGRRAPRPLVQAAFRSTRDPSPYSSAVTPVDPMLIAMQQDGQTRMDIRALGGIDMVPPAELEATDCHPSTPGGSGWDSVERVSMKPGVAQVVRWAGARAGRVSGSRLTPACN
jgi:hypothetical protein